MSSKEDDCDFFKGSDDENLKNFVRSNLWKVRHCKDYENEYVECSCLKGKFHQYFIHGKTLDCSQWRKLMINCEKCMSNDLKACAEVIEHEDNRKKHRISSHLANDVWKKRDAPPSNWNDPLPDWFYEKHQNTFLKEENFCTIC